MNEQPQEGTAGSAPDEMVAPHAEASRRKFLAAMVTTAAVGVVTRSASAAAESQAAQSAGALPVDGTEKPGRADDPKRYDAQLREAWRQFCRQLERAGDHAFKQNVAYPEERAEAFRHLSRGIGFAFERVLEQDPEFPHLLRSYHPNRKQAGDNSSARYHRAIIDGSRTYRIVGNRGSAKWLSISVSAPQQNALLPGQYGYKVVGQPLFGTQLSTEWDGSFVVTLSPEPHEGNWIKTTSEVRSVLVREFFEDWNVERPMVARLELVGAEGKLPPLLHPERFMAALEEVGNLVVSTTEFWPFGSPQIKLLAGATNEVRFLVTSSATQSRSYDINAGGVSGICHWLLSADEALILEFAHFEALYWSFDLLTFWKGTMDYRYRQSSLNSGQAHMDEDGVYRLVVCNGDPGVSNWLDGSGWHEGFIEIRANQCPAPPKITTHVVPRSSLLTHLPVSTRKIDAAGRRAVLAQRSIGVSHRFGDY